MDMATEFTVLRRRRCPECNGAGLISNPIYGDFHEAEKAWEAAHQRPEYDPTSALWRQYTAAHERFENDWFADQGYPGGPRHWPPEELHCDNCQNGVESCEVPLIDALREIGLLQKIAACNRAAVDKVPGDGRCLVNGMIPE